MFRTANPRRIARFGSRFPPKHGSSAICSFYVAVGRFLLMGASGGRASMTIDATKTVSIWKTRDIRSMPLPTKVVMPLPEQTCCHGRNDTNREIQ
jgi:hypothetical protein